MAHTEMTEWEFIKAKFCPDEPPENKFLREGDALLQQAQAGNNDARNLYFNLLRLSILSDAISFPHGGHTFATGIKDTLASEIESADFNSISLLINTEEGLQWVNVLEAHPLIKKHMQAADVSKEPSEPHQSQQPFAEDAWRRESQVRVNAKGAGDAPKLLTHTVYRQAFNRDVLMELSESNTSDFAQAVDNNDLVVWGKSWDFLKEKGHSESRDRQIT